MEAGVNVTQKIKSPRVSLRQIDAEESFAVYKEIADREKSPRVYNEALNMLLAFLQHHPTHDSIPSPMRFVNRK